MCLYRPSDAGFETPDFSEWPAWAPGTSEARSCPGYIGNTELWHIPQALGGSLGHEAAPDGAAQSNDPPAQQATAAEPHNPPAQQAGFIYLEPGQDGDKTGVWGCPDAVLAIDTQASNHEGDLIPAGDVPNVCGDNARCCYRKHCPDGICSMYCLYRPHNPDFQADMPQWVDWATEYGKHCPAYTGSELWYPRGVTDELVAENPAPPAQDQHTADAPQIDGHITVSSNGASPPDSAGSVPDNLFAHIPQVLPDAGSVGTNLQKVGCTDGYEIWVKAAGGTECPSSQPAPSQPLPDHGAPAGNLPAPPAEQPAAPPAEQPANPPAEQPAAPPAEQPVAPPAEQPAAPPAEQPAAPPAEQPAAPPAEQPAAPPAEQPAAPPAAGGTPGGLKIGVISGYGLDARQKEQQIGQITFDSETVYQEAYNIGPFWNGIPRRLDLGLDVTFVIEFTGDGNNMGSLNAMLQGYYDGQLRQLAQLAREDGRPFWLRPFHEFNGDWYPWSVNLHGQNAEIFKAAFRHVVDLLRGEGANNIKYELSYNIWSSTEESRNYANYFPGTEYVDQICVSVYNRNCLETHTVFEDWTMLFREWYDIMWTVNADLPMCIAESSTNSCGGDKPAWIENTFREVADEYTRIREFNWFLENKESDWDLNTEAEKQAFRNGYWYAKDKRG
jgi:hypothetical protein